MKTSYPKQVKDHFLTGESFTLQPESKHGILQTLPQPQPDKIGSYYDSQEYLSHDDSANTLFARVYRTIKTINLKAKKKLLKQYHPHYKSVLDIGAGTGDFLNVLPNHVEKTGVEINEKAALIARTKGLNIAKELEDTNQTYDVITLWHVLEHVYDPEQTLAQIDQRLNKDGLLIIALPNYESFDAKHYKSYWAGYDVPRHLWHFNKSSLSALVQTSNMRVVKFLPMIWDAYYVSLLSEQYKKNKLAPLSAMIMGTISNLCSIFTKEPSSIIYIIRKN